MYPGGIPTTLKEASERVILLNQAMMGGYFGTSATSNFRPFNDVPQNSVVPSTTTMMTKEDGNELMVVDNMQYRQNRGVFRGKCYECQQYGHRAAECPNRNKGNDKGQ